MNSIIDLRTKRHCRFSVLLRNRATRKVIRSLPSGAVACFFGATLLFASTAVGTPFTFSFTGSLNTGREQHTATLLPDGKVLVAGGGHTSVLGGEFIPVASAELYDPATGLWTVTGSMAHPRVGATATLLPNGGPNGGKVLVLGGTDPDINSAELYDPATGLWTGTTSPTYARQAHSVTLLADGKVLVAGGNNEGPNVGELYNPANGTWTDTGPMAGKRFYHAGVLLPDGTVLVAGGVLLLGDGQIASTTTAEIYDPTSATWSGTNTCNLPRIGPTATLLQNGKVFLAGGTYVSPAELFDPSTGSWTLTASFPRFGNGLTTATLLPNGQVLVTGFFEGTTQLYDPASGAWIITGSPNQERYFGHSTTLLQNGNVLVAAGVVIAPEIELYSSAKAEIYDSGATPADRTANMIGEVQGLVTTGALSTNNGSALTSKLSSTVSKLQSGQLNAAANHLGAFANQVQAFMNSGALAVDKGVPLKAEALAVKAAVEVL